jgi:aminoglycoside phosphotransferase family enzyme/predicted kinase
MLGETKELRAIKYPASIDFAEMVGQLAQPGAFPFALSKSEPITVLQTHASAVVLTPSRVYKVKKPKNFGFLNFSTPLLRRHFCEQEVRLNTPRAPHIYLGVAPVLLFSNGRFRFGPTCSPDHVPLSGTSLAGGLVVDYAVVMVRLPEEATLEASVRAGTADALLLTEIAQFVAASHLKAATGEDIARFGGMEVIGGNWEENFEQMKPYIGRTLGEATYGSIVEFVHHFLEERATLFTHRVSAHRIRDCHGDLRLQHVYVLDEQENSVSQLPRLAILDCIEFNERFRYSDVAIEVAFLTMELDALGRPDLAVAFVDEYVAASNDDELPELLPFYTCYRACVRGKVLSFQLDEPEVPSTQRQAACQEANSLFRLAAHYAGSPVRPILVMIGGLMGTGKSTLALALHHELGWKLCTSDMIRKQLAQIDPTQPRADAFDQGLYSAQWTARTYDALRREAGETLSNGRSVLLDASFLHRADRQAVAREAATRGAAAVFIECVCPRDSALQRLAERWKKRVERAFFSSECASSASDGRPDLYDAQCAHWDACIAHEEPDVKHMVVTTTQPLAVNVEQVLEALGIPRLGFQLVSE